MTMEFVVFTGLAVASYLLSKNQDDTSQQHEKQKKQLRQDRDTNITSLDPTTRNIYESDFSRYVRQKEQKLADESFANAVPAGFDKDIPRIVMTRSGRDGNCDFRAASPQDTVKTHNNMVPFFRGEVKQNMNGDVFSRVMETFSGGNDLRQKKSEIAPMFDAVADMSFVNGSPVNVDQYVDRMNVKELRQNELPFEQIRVGPGIGKDIDPTLPSGGFHSFQEQEMIKPRTVDDLRTLNNPKVVREGKTLAGMGPVARPIEPNLVQNRPDRVTDISDRAMPSKSSITKAGVKGDVQLKTTARQNTVSYSGNPADTRLGQKITEFSTEGPLKNKSLSHVQFDVANPVLTSVPPIQDDHGLEAVTSAYVERAGESMYDCPDETPLGIAASIVKAVSAPILDALKITKKDAIAETYRERGNISITFPHKSTVFDPDDKARTTIKETTSIAPDVANLSGPILNVVHDPQNVARTTIKETLIHDTVTGQLKGPTQVVVTYDPEQVARVTTRQTVQPVHYPVMTKTFKKGFVKDPNDLARTTTKETLTDKTIEANIRTLMGKPGAYIEDNTEARVTNRQVTSQEEYFGVAAHTNSDGYDGPNAPFANQPLIATNRQTTSLESSLGPAQSMLTKPVSQESSSAFRTDPSREMTLQNRKPTTSGLKTYLGVDTDEQSTRTRQNLPDFANDHMNVPNKIAMPICTPEVTHVPIVKNCKQDARLFMDIESRNSTNNPLVLPSFHDMADASS